MADFACDFDRQRESPLRPFESDRRRWLFRFGGVMGLAGVFGGTSGFADTFDSDPNRVPISAIPAGFDAILQVSSSLLQHTLSSNLAQARVATLSAHVPYRPEMVTPKLQAAFAAYLTQIDLIRPGLYLELVLSGARLVTLRSSSAVSQPPSVSSGIALAGAPRTRRVVDLSWTLHVNLLRQRPNENAILETTPGTGSGGPETSTGSGPFAGVGSRPGVLIADPAPPPTGLPEGTRTSLAVGMALMQVPTDLVAFPSVFQYWLGLHFSGLTPLYRSDDPLLQEFLGSELATAMLAQVVGPLFARDIRFTPVVALAGNLTASQVASMQLPSVQVQDLVVQDDIGEVLCFCFSLGDENAGVPSLVRSFLSRRDFACYVSEKIFAPALKVRWRANAIHAPLVGDVSVEMPVSPNSEETGQGVARVQVNIHDVLRECGLQASLEHAVGDPMRIVSDQTIRLLRLWYPNGDEVSDLGDLGTPTNQPFVMSLQLFDPLPPNVHQSLQLDLKRLLARVVTPIYRPVLDPLAIKQVSGFASSPMRAFVVRWSLQSPLDTAVGPLSGAVLANS